MHHLSFGGVRAIRLRAHLDVHDVRLEEPVRDVLQDQVISGHGHVLAQTDRFNSKKIRNEFPNFEVDRVLRDLNGGVKVDLALAFGWRLNWRKG